MCNTQGFTVELGGGEMSFSKFSALIAKKNISGCEKFIATQLPGGGGARLRGAGWKRRCWLAGPSGCILGHRRGGVCLMCLYMCLFHLNHNSLCAFATTGESPGGVFQYGQQLMLDGQNPALVSRGAAEVEMKRKGGSLQRGKKQSWTVSFTW